MANVFVTSDQHFGHANILKFTRYDGTPVRPGFVNVSEMDEMMIERWNSVVRQSDKVYVLGDVAMARKDIASIGRCHGHKRLIRGNHDDHPMKYYLPFFEEIYGSRKLGNLLLTHYPVHVSGLNYKVAFNVHGHIHANECPDPKERYINVCVEVTDYTPVPLDDLYKIAKERAVLL